MDIAVPVFIDRAAPIPELHRPLTGTANRAQEIAINGKDSVVLGFTNPNSVPPIDQHKGRRLLQETVTARVHTGIAEGPKALKS
jgi:hypothetical protein